MHYNVRVQLLGYNRALVTASLYPSPPQLFFVPDPVMR